MDGAHSAKIAFQSLERRVMVRFLQAPPPLGGSSPYPNNGSSRAVLAARLGPETGEGCFSPFKSWGSQFKRKVEGKYYLSTQDESTSSESNFFPKAQEHGWVGEWKDSKSAPNSEHLSIGQHVGFSWVSFTHKTFMMESGPAEALENTKAITEDLNLCLSKQGRLLKMLKERYCGQKAH